MRAKGQSKNKHELEAARRQKKPSFHLVLEKSAGAVVFHRGAQVEYLLIRSTYWEFPKGQVEPEESEAEAAVREVKEETGLTVRLLEGFREQIDYFYRRGNSLVKKQVVYFLGEAARQSVKVSWEHHEAKWLPYDEAMGLLKYQNARQVLKHAKEYLDENSRH